MQSQHTDNPAYRHGHASKAGFSPTYQSWSTMLQRCTNPNTDGYRYYGARGVKVCDRWRVFENFLADLGERPENCTLDRIDVDGDYEPANCRWASVKAQANNKRSNVMVEIDGVTKSVSAWCDELGLSRNTVWARVNQYGFSPLEALTRPKQDRVAVAKAMTAKRVASKSMCEFSGKEG